MHPAEERRLRRIFEQGFAAAVELTRDQRRTLMDDGGSSASLNPYAAEPDRTRWTQGFDHARSNNGKPPSPPKPFGRKR